jgi:hypothetical protein
MDVVVELALEQPEISQVFEKDYIITGWLGQTLVKDMGESLIHKLCNALMNNRI